MSSKKRKKGKEFEKLINEIESAINPDCKVEHNVKLVDIETGQKRQIDLVITDEKGEKVAIECRHHEKKQDAKWIEELDGRRKSLEAIAIVGVSKKGFTKPAKVKALARNIILRQIDEFTIDDVIDSFEAPRVELDLLNYACKISGKDSNGERSKFNRPIDSVQFIMPGIVMSLQKFISDKFSSAEIFSIMKEANIYEYHVDVPVQMAQLVWEKEKISLEKMEIIFSRELVRCTVTEILKYNSIISNVDVDTVSDLIRLGDLIKLIGSEENGKGKMEIDTKKIQEEHPHISMQILFQLGSTPISLIRLKGDFEAGSKFSLYEIME